VPPNVIYYNLHITSTGYLTGVLAAAMIPSGGSVGYLNTYNSAEALFVINAFAVGLHKYNPTAKIDLLTINSFDDVFLEKGAEAQFFAEGYDLMTLNSNHPQAQSQFTDNGRFAIGAFSESRSILGENMLTSGALNWAPIYYYAIQKALDFNLSGENILRGYKDGGPYLSEFSGKVPPSAVELVNYEESQLLLYGEYNYMICGPFYDSAGVLRIPAGRCADNTDMINTDYVSEFVTSSTDFVPVPPEHDDSGLRDTIPIIYNAVLLACYALGLFYVIFIVVYSAKPIVKFAQPRFIIASIVGCCLGVTAIYPCM
jgi:hypothetical protein